MSNDAVGQLHVKRDKDAGPVSQLRSAGRRGVRWGLPRTSTGKVDPYPACAHGR